MTIERARECDYRLSLVAIFLQIVDINSQSDEIHFIDATSRY